MSTKKILNLYILICLFPAWILSSNILLNDKILYFIPYTIFFIILTCFLNLELKSKFNLILLTILTVFAFDQNLSLYQNLVKPNFNFLNRSFSNIYFAELYILVVIFVIIFTIIYLSKIKSIKILF